MIRLSIAHNSQLYSFISIIILLLNCHLYGTWKK